MKIAWLMMAMLLAATTVAGNSGADARTTRPAPADSAAIAAALADPARTDQAGDDARRQAAAVIAFSGVRLGDTVVDFLPGAGYWTRIFTNVVGPRGHVYAVWTASEARYAERPLPALRARNLANVTAAVLPTDALTFDRPVDLVWIVQNYHDLDNSPAGEAAIDAINRSVFAALRPGGSYVVIDHADAAGTGLSGTDTRHRIDPAIVRREVERAGFHFAGASDVLRNPADDHSMAVFDPAIRGHTDQFVYRFVKPGRRERR